jgi:hypothetical protein
LHSIVIKHIRKYGSAFVKEIPFEVIWNSFWNVDKAHIFIEESHKTAVIYAYNLETKQYIGGLLDTTVKKNIDLFHKEHSIYKREAIVVKNGEIIRKFKK